MSTSVDQAVESIAPKPSRRLHVAVPVPAAVRSARSSRGTLPIGLGILGFLALVSVVSLIWTPYSPTKTGAGAVGSAPSSAHWFGTDSVGSDVFSRTISAGRTDVFYTVAVVTISLVVGSIWGAFAGFFGGWFEAITLRLLEVV
jgi:peptide/nickel transport system permease protein